MLEVYTAQCPDEPERNIPGDCVVLSILIGDANALGANSYISPRDQMDAGIDEVPVQGSYLFGKWSLLQLEDRYNSQEIAHWVPMTVGGGQGIGDAPVGFHVGPELSLGSTRLAQLKPHSRDKRRFKHCVVKVAAPGACLGLIPNPRGSFSPLHDSDHALFNVLVERHLSAAIAELEGQEKRVLLDAVYLCLGTNDARPHKPNEGLVEQVPRNLRLLHDAIAAALGIHEVPVVASLPIFVEPLIPGGNTDEIRQAFKAYEEQCEHFFTVEIDDLERQDNQEHLTGRGQLGHGQRFARVWDSQTTVLQEIGIDEAREDAREDVEEGAA